MTEAETRVLEAAKDAFNGQYQVDVQINLVNATRALLEETPRPEAVAITPERMKIVRDFLTEMLQIARNNGLRSSVSEQRSPLDGFVALGEKQCLEDAIAVLDSEVAKDTIIRNLQDSLPVARCRPGSMWQYELHYAGYWYVKRSHAYRAITAAIQQEHDIRTDREGTIAMLAEALGVEHEPHQTFFERLVEAASTRSPLAMPRYPMSPNEEALWDAIYELRRDLALAKLPVIGECEDCGHKVVTPLTRREPQQESK